MLIHRIRPQKCSPDTFGVVSRLMHNNDWDLNTVMLLGYNSNEAELLSQMEEGQLVEEVLQH